jgi:DNA polymerase-3 subunit epsilon
MDNFVAIDFETANFAQSSVCSVGLVIVKDGEIVDNYYSLIRPIPNYYNARCSEVNGLHFDDTNGAPEFPDVWSEAVRKVHEYFPYIEDGEVPFVAHNKAFDENCLKAVFRAYEIAYPDYEFECTLLRSRKVYPEVPPRVEYALTERGRSLMPHVSALIGWAVEHFDEIAKE